MAVKIAGVTRRLGDDLITGAALDTPQMGSVDGHTIEVNGWVVGKAPVVKVEFVHEGTAFVSCELDVSRPDVAAAFGGSSQVGFRKMIETGGLAADFIVGVRVVFQDGRRSDIAEIRGTQVRQTVASPMHDFDAATRSFRMLGVPYLNFLVALHTHLTPRSYLEVGTASGSSLAVANCDAIAVDPEFQLDGNSTGNRRRTFFFQMTSDDFFATESAPALLGRPVDMAFLDGMHQFEYLLRDFIGAEAACHSRSLILLHDCVPLNPRMALREWLPGGPLETDTACFWTGDVWKLLPILRQYRPELRLHVLDCPPTGLVAITGLDPGSSILTERYYEIVDQHAATVLDEDGLRSFWDDLELVASQPLCEQPGRLTDLFRPDGPNQPNRPLPRNGGRQEPADQTNTLPPRELQDWVGGGGPAAFSATGNEFLSYLVDLCGLQPGDAVLDVGCGSGRMALPLTGYLNREGRYAGFDVSKEAIAWCTDNISGSHSNFDFTVVDIQNSLYNPTGRYEASDFRFPYPDESFDVVLLASLFTHMLPADVKHYLREIVRVLKPGGRSLNTFFLFNEESLALSKEGRASFNFEHEMPGYRTTHVDHPEAATAYPEAFVRDAYRECGLELREPLRYGRWSGRTNGMSGQDVVIAVKTASRDRLVHVAHASDVGRPAGSDENIAFAEVVSRNTQKYDADPPR